MNDQLKNLIKELKSHLKKETQFYKKLSEKTDNLLPELIQNNTPDELEQLNNLIPENLDIELIPYEFTDLLLIATIHFDLFERGIKKPNMLKRTNPEKYIRMITTKAREIDNLPIIIKK
jgi:hypothetical protein